MDRTCATCGLCAKAPEMRGELVEPPDVFTLTTVERETGELGIEQATIGWGCTTTLVCLAQEQDFPVPEDNTPDPLRAEQMMKILSADRSKCPGWTPLSKFLSATKHLKLRHAASIK